MNRFGIYFTETQFKTKRFLFVFKRTIKRTDWVLFKSYLTLDDVHYALEHDEALKNKIVGRDTVWLVDAEKNDAYKINLRRQ